MTKLYRQDADPECYITTQHHITSLKDVTSAPAQLYEKVGLSFKFRVDVRASNNLNTHLKLPE